MPDLSQLVVPAWVSLLLNVLLIVVAATLALRFARGFAHRLFKGACRPRIAGRP